jgi:hypothetical protein
LFPLDSVVFYPDGNSQGNTRVIFEDLPVRFSRFQKFLGQNIPVLVAKHKLVLKECGLFRIK